MTTVAQPTDFAPPITRVTAKAILDQLWDGITAGRHDSVLYDELILNGWPQHSESESVIGGELRTFVCVACGGTGSQPTHRTDCPLHGAGYTGRHRAPDFGLRDKLAIASGKKLAAEMHAWLNSPLGTDPLDLPLWSARAFHALKELIRDA
jgi:hypothetical protein